MVKAIHIDMPTGPSNLFSPQLRLLSQVTLGCVKMRIKTIQTQKEEEEGEGVVLCIYIPLVKGLQKI